MDLDEIFKERESINASIVTKINEAATPSKTKKLKDTKPSRRERWENKQKNNN